MQPRPTAAHRPQPGPGLRPWVLACSLTLSSLATSCASLPGAGESSSLGADGTRPPSGDPARDANGDAAATSDARAAAIEAIHRGDFVQARGVLAELLVADYLERGRRLFDEGKPRDALLPLDEAVSLAAEDPQAWYERGRAAFATAATDSQPQFFYEDALSNFETAARLGRGTAALVYASRSARMASDSQKALTYARAAAAMPTDEALEVSPARTLAEAAFGVYVELRGAEEDAAALFSETETTLSGLIGETPEDPWAWLQLANLYQWEERLGDAQKTLENGLDLMPDDESLHNRLVLVASESSGREGVFEYYTRFRTRHPGEPLGAWYPAVQHFEQALDEFRAATQPEPSVDEGAATDEGGEVATEASVASDEGAQVGADTASDAAPVLNCDAFRRAELAFRECRAMDPGVETACLGYEVVCRAGLGWCRHAQGDLRGAKQAFLSTEDVLEGGLLWQIEGRLGSALLGLELVLYEYSKEPLDVDSMVNAAAIADYIHAYLPEDADKANNAGFFNRDAAVLLENEALLALHLARESADAAEKAELERQAERQRARAVELMQRSFAAYEEAVRLNPDDVRVVNDTGLVMVYYLRDDVEAAERYLQRSIDLGAEQIPSSTLEGQELVDLKEAWGDAHQNMGLVYLTLKNDPARAKTYFERAIEIGPPEVARAIVREQFLPLCDRVLAGDNEAIAETIQPVLVWLYRDN